eukprot:3934252-Pleurochrysis_carterae.AAC.4
MESDHRVVRGQVRGMPSYPTFSRCTFDQCEALRRRCCSLWSARFCIRLPTGPARSTMGSQVRPSLVSAPSWRNITRMQLATTTTPPPLNLQAGLLNMLTAARALQTNAPRSIKVASNGDR